MAVAGETTAAASPAFPWGQHSFHSTTAYTIMVTVTALADKWREPVAPYNITVDRVPVR